MRRCASEVGGENVKRTNRARKVDDEGLENLRNVYYRQGLVIYEIWPSPEGEFLKREIS